MKKISLNKRAIANIRGELDVKRVDRTLSLTYLNQFFLFNNMCGRMLDLCATSYTDCGWAMPLESCKCTSCSLTQKFMSMASLHFGCLNLLSIQRWCYGCLLCHWFYFLCFFKPLILNYCCDLHDLSIKSMYVRWN